MTQKSGCNLKFDPCLLTHIGWFLHTFPFAPPQVEGIGIDEDSLAYLGEIGERTSLRHGVQLLTPAFIMAKTNGRDEISRGDLEETDSLFLDAKMSAKLLAAQADKYIS